MKKSASKQFNINDVKDPDLRAYIQHLADSLSRQNQELKILSQVNRIYQNFFQYKNNRERIKQIAGEIQLPGSNSIRILIYQKTAFGGNESFIAKNGEYTEEFAYLDEQIVQQLKEKDQLLIPDTSRIHSIKFTPEKKFPKSIAAFRFLDLDDASGYFWVSFDSAREFTDFELSLLSRISTSIREVCDISFIQGDLEDSSKIFYQALSFVNLPILVLNQQKEIAYENTSAKNQFKGNYSLIKNNQKISDFLNSNDADLTLELEMADRIFQIIGKRIITNGESGSIQLILSDETIASKKQAYLSLVMDTISHDFRVPLINMQGFSKMLPMVGGLNAKQVDYLNMITSGIEETLKVIDDLYDLGRISRDDGLKITGNPPQEIIDKAISLIQADARQKRISIECAQSETHAIVLIDRVLIISALYNLLNNAVSHSRLGGMIKVEEKTEGKNWIIAVQDFGKGISQIDIEKMKNDRFITKSSSGLSIVNRIAKVHKGELLVQSELGKGSRFILQLPCIE